MRIFIWLMVLALIVLSGISNLVGQSSLTPQATASSTLIVETPTPTLVSEVLQNTDWTPLMQTINGLDMMLVPPGSFLMGSTPDQISAAFQLCLKTFGERTCNRNWYENEGPQTNFHFDTPFWIGRTEVTNGQYRQCVVAGVCRPPSDSYYYNNPSYDDYPVLYMYWGQAATYAEWWGGRLPTEAEWEYAARGPDNLIYPWGNDFDGTKLNSCDITCPDAQGDSTANDGYRGVAPVDMYPQGASWVGALDMSGNAFEWVNSSDAPYPYVSDDGREDPNNLRYGRELRGGSWFHPAIGVRTVTRAGLALSDPYIGNVGFRVARLY